MIRIYFPISNPAKPSANQSAGENGLTNVPTIFPIIIKYAVDNKSIPKLVAIDSTTGNNAK